MRRTQTDERDEWVYKRSDRALRRHNDTVAKLVVSKGYLSVLKKNAGRTNNARRSRVLSLRVSASWNKE